MKRRPDPARSADEASADTGLSRRAFLKKSALAPALIGMAGAIEIKAAPASTPPRTRPAHADALQCAVIGFGPQGRAIAAELTRIEDAEVAVVCDDYPLMLRRAQRDVPNARTEADYRAVLADPAIQAVCIATPTHLHRQVALDALAAGKHVYCEAPMAGTIDDARVIAQAARDATSQIFQVGLLARTEPQHKSVHGFISSGALGTPAFARSQWHSKKSWRRTSTNREREQALNWRLDPAHTLGLAGEVGSQQLDAILWMLQRRPVAVTGFGQVRFWNDGRTIPDTIQLIFELSDGTHLFFDASLATSFDAAYDMYYGSNSTIMLRDNKAWMFKEVDAPMLGWEVYARRDKFYKENGIALVANATKLDAQNVDPTADDPNAETPLYHALKEFTDNTFYGPFPPSAGYAEGFLMTVVAAKAHEAVMQNTKLMLDDALFEIG